MTTYKIISLILLQVNFIANSYTENVPSVIIIGAGPAGIAAASKLFENNITNVKILEAENRIGGRVHSVPFGDSIVDLGAQWCHGENNIVHELAEKYNILTPSIYKADYYHSSGKPIDTEFAEELANLGEELVNANTEDGEGISTAEYVTKMYNRIINERYTDNQEQLNFAREFIDIIEHDCEALDGSFSWSHTSAKSDYTPTEGNQFISWNGHGYKTILEILMKSYPNPTEQLPIMENVHFNKEVVEINWKNGIKVKCLDNSTFTADHVIFTPSLGVLKERHRILFNPSLPIEKISVIESLGMEAVKKILLHFPTVWWEENAFMGFIWGEDDKLELMKSNRDDPDKLGKLWLEGFYVLHTIENNPNILETWITSTHISKIEKLPDDEIVEGVMFAINKFLGQKYANISTPDAILHYNWYSNSHFRGVYSFQTVESRKNGISPESVLAEPLLSADNGKPILLFAGEATNPISYSTVHGAIETGFREARRIIDLYQ